MNIAFFSDSYRPYTSGVVRSIETFSAEFRSLGHKVYIFAPNYPNCKKEEDVFRFISVPSLAHQDFTLAIPISPTLGKTVQSLGIDIIHVHSPFLLGRLGAKIAKKLGIPLVYTYHTLYDQYVHYVPIAQNFSRWVVRKVSKDFCNNCDLVVVPTGVIEEVLRQYGVTTEIEPIPTGIDLRDYANGNAGWLRQTYQIPENDLVLLYVGRLGLEKNLDFLLQSFQQILQAAPQTTLVLVGGGPQEEYFKELCTTLQIGHKVVFTGTLDRAKVVNAYLGADLFVFASVTETQGLVLGEAKAAGLPIVAVEAFGAKEMINPGIDGYLTPLVQEVFVDRILQLLADPEERKRLGNNARQNVEKISASNSAKLLLKCYQNLLAHKYQAAVG
jgi:glycosyltransferase involved in cell wall biosynthesis